MLFSQIGDLLEGFSSLVFAMLFPVAVVKAMRVYCGAFGNYKDRRPKVDE